MQLHCHLKMMETYANGVVSYLFFLKKNPTDAQFERIAFDSILLMTTSSFMVDLLIQKKVSALELRYLQACYNYCHHFMQ